MVIKRLLTNKFVLYFTVFLALMNVIGYLQMNNMKALTFFLALGYLSSYFSKNMIINLVIAILGTNIFMLNRNMREGFKNGKDKKATNNGDNGDNGDDNGDDEDDDDDSDDEEGLSMRTVDNSSKLQPYDDNDADRIDSAATLEASYKNLESVLGPGGMRNLASDTRSLVKQQKELMRSVKHMNPMIKQLGGMVNSFGGVDGINSMMKNLKMMGGMPRPPPLCRLCGKTGHDDSSCPQKQ